MAELSNCITCGVVFLKAYSPLCRSCYEKEEQWYSVVSTFLKKRENRLVTQADIILATSIPAKTLNSFIRSGRLMLQDHPNLQHPCERCNQLTQEKRYCANCVDELSAGWLTQTSQAIEENNNHEALNRYSLKNTLRKEE
ncbi:hypothetical protein [Shouchella patagoniensis]|uniref:hypothetical protein n=1 Tax=Shouchella patagoniensis TaxID=228576 RepID=UPI000994C02B|nr:hypothetical protein [Shouchella patagoniensis]